MVEKFYNMPEIIVSTKKLTKSIQTYGYNSVLYKSIFQCPSGMEIALRILPNKNHSYLKRVSFFIDNIGIPDSPFGIRLYSVDSITLKPDILIQTKDIITKGYKGNEWVKYEFENPIEVPNNGFYIAMEWLPSSKRYLEQQIKGHNGTIVANGQVLKSNRNKSKKWKNRVFTRWFPIKEWTNSDFTPAIKCEIEEYR